MRQKQQKYDNHTKGKNKQASKQASKKKKQTTETEYERSKHLYV